LNDIIYIKKNSLQLFNYNKFPLIAVTLAKWTKTFLLFHHIVAYPTHNMRATKEKHTKVYLIAKIALRFFQFQIQNNIIYFAKNLLVGGRGGGVKCKLTFLINQRFKSIQGSKIWAQKSSSFLL